MEDEFSENVQILSNLHISIDELNRRMAVYLLEIKAAARFQRSCGSA